MEKISVSEFKAICLRLLREVNKTGKQILITKDGEDLAIISPPSKKKQRKTAFGALKARTKINIDLSLPLQLGDWKVLKD
jgi:prevent-host-death family protein